MVATHFSGPIIAPGVGSRFSSPWATHYFVDADDGTDGDGKTPDAAFTTIQAAVTAAQYQDIIYIRPRTYTLGTGFARYVEDVTVTLGGSGGSGATATNANMSLIGITPNAHPSDFLGVRWKYTSATCLTVDAPCLHVENIGFFTEAATYAINLRCDGVTRTQEGTTGFSIYNCAIKGDGALYGNGCTEIQIIKCRFQAKYDGTTGGINLVGTTNAVYRPIIKDCDFVGGNANAMATAPIIGASPWYTAVLANLWFDKDTTAGQFVAIGGTTSTGVCGPCFCGSGDISTTSFDTAGIEVVGAFDDDGIQNGADA